jgi:hypothetical protein
LDRAKAVRATIFSLPLAIKFFYIHDTDHCHLLLAQDRVIKLFSFGQDNQALEALLITQMLQYHQFQV